jgi:ribokinase
MSNFDVIGFGALNVDKLYKVNRIAGAEEESPIEAYSQTSGGSAANTIVGLARLGCRVGFIGKVGNDPEGKVLIDDLRKESVDTSGIAKSEDHRSGSVMGFVDRKGARALYIDSGSNDTIDTNDVRCDYVSETRFLHLTSFVGDKSFQTQKEVLRDLPSDVRVSFDPGALYARKGFSQLEPIVKRTYVLMPNIFELKLLTGESDYKAGAQYLVRKGVLIVAVKLGEEGCYVTDGSEGHRIDAVKVKVVDTTGAGDAFCAGFLYGLLGKRSLLECGKIGNFVASRCIMEMGARTGLPYLKDLRAG